MKKSDLKYGNVVVTREGIKYLNSLFSKTMNFLIKMVIAL